MYFNEILFCCAKPAGAPVDVACLIATTRPDFDSADPPSPEVKLNLFKANDLQEFPKS
ncbi:hypothetical protein [Antarcticimicrobium luteum]|uniref:hypothetical protein n=1 Tax=Antarcticimicrobium luteum TaxID=2547397 RepID=UPI00140A2790|nr:hypothetical protein [Antarcticimicrobium luteum]